ncbi:MAG TPA: PQQ-dependent sugar dehydrogenase [Thermoleophilia bacterium]|nr:PQQ-dependent sugar dehydrogenase [Thermoleophilia bacterium]
MILWTLVVLAVVAATTVAVVAATTGRDTAGAENVSATATPGSSAGPDAATTRLAAVPAVRLRVVARGLSQPLYVTAPPGDTTRLFVVEKTGRIRVVKNGRLLSTPFLNLHSRVSSGSEQGLLSMAFDPKYSSNRFFYVDYTNLSGDTRVVRYRASASHPNRAVASSAKVLLKVHQPFANHNGGQLQFGPDGRLYIGLGDGGSEGDPNDNGQNLHTRLAKILTLNVRVAGAAPRMYAYGLRNPWRFSFDSATGDLYIGDVGQDKWEEIDYLPRTTNKLVNFGWNRFEGNHVYDSSTQLAGPGVYRAPIAEYSHSDGCAVDGGYVYRGTTLPPNVGRYFYGDNCSGNIWSLEVVGGKATAVRKEPFTVPGLSSFAVDGSGELYLMSVSSGSLYRLSP